MYCTPTYLRCTTSLVLVRDDVSRVASVAAPSEKGKLSGTDERVPDRGKKSKKEEEGGKTLSPDEVAAVIAKRQCVHFRCSDVCVDCGGG